MQEWLDSQEFYELMQAYRTAPLFPQSQVIQAFKDVKAAILKKIEDDNAPDLSQDRWDAERNS